MPDYISREAVIDSLVGWAAQLTEPYGKNDEYVRCLESAAYNIEQLPASDVRPVVRGKWEEVDRAPIFEGMEKHSTYRCSSCRAYQFYDVFDDGTARYNFCPNCGADMREES